VGIAKQETSWPRRLADAGAELIFGGFVYVIVRALVPRTPLLALVAGLLGVYVETRRHARERAADGSTHQGVRREWLVFTAILIALPMVLFGVVEVSGLGQL
jgi:hypothetical protein